MEITEVLLQVVDSLALSPMVRILVEETQVLAVGLPPVGELDGYDDIGNGSGVVSQVSRKVVSAICSACIAMVEEAGF